MPPRLATAHEFGNQSQIHADAAVVSHQGVRRARNAHSGGKDAMVAFLGLQPQHAVHPLKAHPLSFKKVMINFWPHMEGVELQQMECQDDMAVCNRECERAYGERQAELEEPCKLAVAKYYTGGACFPAQAAVQDAGKRQHRMCDVEVEHELLGADGQANRVIALLHARRGKTFYLELHHSGGVLNISPDHLLRVRQKDQAEQAWRWLPAQAVWPGDELWGMDGPLVVHGITSAVLEGAYAPLTEAGVILVDGVLCSCYSPPAAWGLTHQICHRAMLPLRLADQARQQVESLTQVNAESEPFLSIDVLWLLPRVADASIHPYASGLLWLATFLVQGAEKCSSSRLEGSRGGHKPLVTASLTDE
mmetsp:Transcript_9579/g.21942  ORF Transcript_9579/g.21942 Transcript_9579/m.21942 type:complete len:363 (-) Transcript_9579:31-1119(-)